MSVCRNLEELQTLLSQRLPAWSDPRDFINIAAAWRGTTVARGTFLLLNSHYLPLVPRIRLAVDCSIVLWALAQPGLASDGAAEAQLGPALLQHLVEPRELSNILLALKGLQLGSEQAELVAAVAAEGMRRGFDGYDPQALSNSAWALAQMSSEIGLDVPAWQRQWFAAAAEAARRPGAMAGAKPQAWSNLLYALALVRQQPPPELFDASTDVFTANGNVQDCTNTLWAMAVLQLRHAGLEAAFRNRLGELLQRDPECAVCSVHVRM
ncbi:hypothetical protein HYH02_010659 [Chlamydomonas schloesseri]|uniref:Uncharacterized protein n=1 Tax=Chlamydomonas schloesseri TaxID=2026947 RepID=A0A835W414_9CHLO|nr:hypothetical protein HYH02_010659 [Chlamydomonas schloesseri]|eukprot:KAG2439782.1 hypothetical protein HYH02_010659 [Chlamydomonas schloesseri]